MIKGGQDERDIPDEIPQGFDDDGNPVLSDDDKIIKEARQRFHTVTDWEKYARDRFLDDYKFAEADADNGYQWPNDVRTNRNVDERPCLTINKTRQHCLHIINDAKKNKPSVKIKPTGNGSTYEASQIFEGIVRHIEYISNAQTAYDTATGFQVKGGIGYWRLVTDYVDDDTFDQEVFIRRVVDPLTVYMDPEAQEADKSDSRYAFVFDDMPLEDFKRAYPQAGRHPSLTALDNYQGWMTDKHVRVAEYYRVVRKEHNMYAGRHPKFGQLIGREDKLKSIMGDHFKELVDDPETKIRSVFDNQVEWYLIGGDEILERNIWPGKYIPIVPVIGEETVIEGRLDRKGHVRALKDPQRMYNYWSSSAVEHVALQGKTPYVAPAEAIEGYETYWNEANRQNFSVLPYNQFDDAGQTLQKPERQQPPMMSSAYMQGMTVASEELRAASGQYQAEMGQPGNERSGAAIEQRQRQGETATYHFIDNLAIAIRCTGKMLIDLIPKIYDTKRVIKIIAEDGVEHEVEIDPEATKAYAEKQSQIAGQVKSIFNPAVGRYAVEADVGPAYATRRQETFNAFMQIISQAPDILKIAGDLMFQAADFPMAGALAERIKRSIPPAILGEGPSPQEQQMQQQMQQMQASVQHLTELLAEEKSKSRSRDAHDSIGAYNAETARMKVLEPEIRAQAQGIIEQLIRDALSTNITASDTAQQGDPNDQPDPSQLLAGAQGAPPQGQPQ